MPPERLAVDPSGQAHRKSGCFLRGSGDKCGSLTRTVRGGGEGKGAPPKSQVTPPPSEALHWVRMKCKWQHLDLWV